jgi:hypothetical protein
MERDIMTRSMARDHDHEDFEGEIHENENNSGQRRARDLQQKSCLGCADYDNPRGREDLQDRHTDHENTGMLCAAGESINGSQNDAGDRGIPLTQEVQQGNTLRKMVDEMRNELSTTLTGIIKDAVRPSQQHAATGQNQLPERRQAQELQPERRQTGTRADRNRRLGSPGYSTNEEDDLQ